MRKALMKTLMWLIVGFSAAVILPNKIGTPELPAVRGNRTVTSTAGDAIQPIAAIDAGILACHQSLNAATSALDLREVRRGDSPVVRSQLCRLQL
jgi:hypothetical protein